MAQFDYSDVKKFLHDDELIRLLCADRAFPQLLEDFAADDFLSIDRSMKVPFFAEVRDYVGAAERADLGAHWIVKPISAEDARGPAMGAICFFLDFFTRTNSAATIVTRIDGVVYKATRIKIGRP